MIHWSIGGLLDATHAMAFVSAVEAIEALGGTIAVEGAVVTIEGAEARPPWVDVAIARWAGIFTHAHRLTREVWHVYVCTQCCFPELRRAAARQRRCVMCGERSSMYELTIPWATPPLRPPRRRRRSEPQ